MKIYHIEIYYRCGTCSIGISNTPPQSKQGSKTVWIEKLEMQNRIHSRGCAQRAYLATNPHTAAQLGKLCNVLN